MAVTVEEVVPDNGSSKGRRVVTPYRGPDLQLPPHPDAPDPVDLAAVRRWVREARRPTAIDLFCGAGGLSLGLKDAGFSVLVGADVDDRSVETHTANIGGLGYVGDLADPEDFLDHVCAWGIKTVDLVAGGPPCQPFSRGWEVKDSQLGCRGPAIGRGPTRPCLGRLHQGR